MSSSSVALPRRLASEMVGSLLLAAAVVGSGIMAERLASGNGAVALLANTVATAAVLAALIALLGPVSGAHFNPAVSLIEALRGRLAWTDAVPYLVAQVLGCCVGALLAHSMFEMPLWQASLHIRAGPAQICVRIGDRLERFMRQHVVGRIDQGAVGLGAGVLTADDLLIGLHGIQHRAHIQEFGHSVIGTEVERTEIVLGIPCQSYRSTHRSRA